MFFNKKSGFKSILLILIPVFLLSISCNKDEEKKEDTTVFNANDSALVQSSVIDLPSSLKSSQISQQIDTTEVNSIKMLTRADSSSGNSQIMGIYEGVTMYVAVADMMRGFAKEILKNIIGSPILKKEFIGSEITLPADPSDPNGPKKVKVEKPDNEAYEWKISLYFSDLNNPDMIVRFSIFSNGAKGRILWKMTEEDEDLAEKGFTGIEITRKIDITFDGTVSPKILDLKMDQDLSNLVKYGQDNWASLTDQQRQDLDLGQPSKVVLNAKYDESKEEYVIYGTSYHPTWKDQALLEGKTSMFGEGRTMYMFKAMSKETADVKASKVYLSLPLETTSTITGLWENDSIAAIYTPLFKEMIKVQINSYIASQTESQKYYTMYYVLGASGLGITPITVESMAARATQNTFTQAEYDAFKAWYSRYPDSNIDLNAAYLSTLTAFNSTYQNTDSNGKLWMVTVVNLEQFVKPEIDNNRPDPKFELTALEFQNFIDYNSDPNAAALKNMTKEIAYILNPAFFKEGGTCMGTYNESTSTYNKYDTGAWSETTDGTQVPLMSAVESFDLSQIDPMVPTDVVNMTITIE